MTDSPPDLFGYRAPQGDFFANEQPRNPGIVSADPVKVRLRLQRLLSEARTARATSPWNERTTRLYQVVFPQMANWLPDLEAKQLCMEFEAELERLRLA